MAKQKQELTPAYKRPVDRASIDSRMAAQLDFEDNYGRFSPRDMDFGTERGGKKLLTKGKIIGATVLTSLGIAGYETGVIQNANAPHGRAIPMHVVKHGNGIEGGVSFSQQGNAPAEKVENP